MRRTYEYIRRCLLVLSASSAASAFLLLLLVLLLLLLLAAAASAAASAAAAAAAAAAATALRTAGWSCSVFFCVFQLSCESYVVMDVVQNPQKSSGYDQGTTMKKNM